jgi:hypothetical protein
VTKQTPKCVEYPSGDKHWFLNDKFHREDGPAIEHSNGDKEWYLNDKFYSPQQYVEKVLEYGVLCWWDKEKEEMVFL